MDYILMQTKIGYALCQNAESYMILNGKMIHVVLYEMQKMAV